MDVVQEGLDTLADLEARINRAVGVISALRQENQQLAGRLDALQEQFTALESEHESDQTALAEVRKENEELAERSQRLSGELEGLRGERKQVKVRIEKLLNQLDLLSAS